MARSVVRRPAAMALAAAVFATVLVVLVPPAHADGCYTWTRTLRQGMSGGDVSTLQHRIAGWVGYREVLAIDGSFGAATDAALRRFQSGYGLTSDGIAGSQTYSKLYELQKDADCTPAHFSYSEFRSCQGGFTGGAVSESKVRSNLLKVMWKLEALRKKLGSVPLTITSGFRSYACNSGSSNSQHLYGTAADVVSSGASLCTIARAARYAGFSGIIGPGDPDHNDHVHLDLRYENNDDGITNGWYWYAPSCSGF